MLSFKTSLQNKNDMSPCATCWLEQETLCSHSTPCLMMSPLTVSQYLMPGRVIFDLVVMDEASQIKPESALGALLRSRQAVIVGDPQQLPPTNFFERAIEDNDDNGEGEDDQLTSDDKIAGEFILDLAKQAFRPSRRLRWHYRSQHENLIKFSNREFYDDHLIVFPSAQPPSATLGIELVQVNGRWAAQINVDEARAVARVAAQFMRDHPLLSHGIVAMNQSQRELIEAELGQLSASDSAIATYRDKWEAKLEAPFVKNLENVQGDERDVIFVSLGWGRTPEGAIHQRFFPVNRREDGHRRLNVLFTRAKQKIVLFSSLKPEHIVVDPERTARGVRVLRDYLEYARDGRVERGFGSGEIEESPFEASVARALRHKGHNIALQVGVSGYRIDIAVRHPDMSERFVLGIECDGATYHRAKSARDRDRLRQEALERVGWKLTRVWSTDWFRDPDAQTTRLSAEIAEAVRRTNLDDTGRRWLVEEFGEDTPVADAPIVEEFGSTSKVVSKAAGPNVNAETPNDELPQLRANEPSSNSLSTNDTTADHDDQSITCPPVATDIRTALRHFRDHVIMTELPGSDPNRCILRELMIDAIVTSGLDEKDDFTSAIPSKLRLGTDGRQGRYLARICDIVTIYRGADKVANKAIIVDDVFVSTAKRPDG